MGMTNREMHPRKRRAAELIGALVCKGHRSEAIAVALGVRRTRVLSWLAGQTGPTGVEMWIRIEQMAREAGIEVPEVS